MQVMDPYALLGVAPGAGERELARAYRRLAKRWHPDDAMTGRVRSVRFEAIAGGEHRLRWPLRRAVLRVRGKNGRRHAFAGLRPDTAAQIAVRVRAAAR